MDRFIENLKTQVEENPVFALGVAAGLITAIGKLVEAKAKYGNSKTWDKEVDRRVKKILKDQK